VTPEIILLLVIIAITLVLFSLERIPADVVALGVMLSLILTGLLPAEQAFAGFGSDTVMMILGLLILTAALTRTGVVSQVGRLVMRYTGQEPKRLLTIIVISAAVMSAFMSNTASAAFFLPIVLGLAQRTRTSASQLLMPLAFATILTSSVTLVSTSTNLVVSGLLTQYGYEPLGMLELSPVGIPIAIAGIIYMLTIGRRLIPNRLGDDEFEQPFAARVYLTEVMILPGSPLTGKTLAESGLGSELDLNVLRIVRGKNRYFGARATQRLEEGDVLLVEGKRDEILKIKDTAGIDIKADVKLGDPDLASDEAEMIEAILLPGSSMIGRTLKRFRFRERYGLQVLAINRQGETIRRKISQVQLRMGDVLLVQGRRSNLALLASDRSLGIVGGVEEQRPNLQRAPLAVAIFVGALALATLGIVSLPVAVLLGALVAFATRCITPEEAYREVEWKAIILIGAMLSLGAAMQATGTADFIAAQLVALVGEANPLALLSGFFVLTVLLTQPMSNQAAAIVVVPIALQLATQLNLNPRTFAMMIAVAASCSYLTPLEPACLMVYGPGRYKFIDFLKVGSLLTAVVFVIAIVLVPIIWPINGVMP
jgi:di/tricarboxylate transporter